MILTVTLNPLLERRYYYTAIDLSSVNRDGLVTLKAGGKGININRQLNKLGVQNVALLFTGGNNGKLLRESLHNENITFSDIRTRNETRDAAIIIDQSSKKVYSFFRSDVEVASSEVDNFILKMEKMISTCELVVFSGSSPCLETDIIFPEGIRMANRMDKISVCDTYGNHLENCINASPTIIHSNVGEIKSSLGSVLNIENDYIDLLNTLYGKGIKQAFITDAEKPFYASNFDFHYKITLPKIETVDSTGSGDAFTAGIIYGWHNKLNFEQQIRFASALGIRNAQSFEVCDVDTESAQSLVEQIKISSVGKKIKEINDLPG
jgi:1-phosphofructokinase family hexose kinase